MMAALPEMYALEECQKTSGITNIWEEYVGILQLYVGRPNAPCLWLVF